MVSESTKELPKRAMCTQCRRALSACICSCVQLVQNRVEVLILQHPQESKHIKSSGRLLQLCLPSSQLQIGETFSSAELEAWINADQRQSVLLYPEEPDSSVRHTPRTDVLSQTPEQLRLIVIDASWRQSRQILREHSLLQLLPRFPLRDAPASRYLIRQAHKIDQLSSLEACVYALMRLEQNASRYQPVLDAFDDFNQLQIRFGVQRLQRH